MGVKHSQIEEPDGLTEEEKILFDAKKAAIWKLEDEEYEAQKNKYEEDERLRIEQMIEDSILRDEQINEQYILEQITHHSKMEQIRETPEFKQSIIDEDAGIKPLKFIINAHGSVPIHKHVEGYNTMFVLPENAYLITSSANGEVLYMNETNLFEINNEFTINPFFENENTTNNPTPFLLDLENRLTTSETNYNFANHLPLFPVNNIMLSGEYNKLVNYTGWWKVGYNNEMNSCLGRSFGNEYKEEGVIGQTSTSANLEEVINEILECYPGKTCIILVLACRGNDRDNWILDVGIELIYNSPIVFDTLNMDTVDTIYSSLPKTFEPSMAYSIARSIELLKEIGLPITNLNIIYALSILPADRSGNPLSQTPRVIKAVASPRSRRFGNNITIKKIESRLFTIFHKYTLNEFKQATEYGILIRLYSSGLSLSILTQLVPIIISCFDTVTNMIELEDCTISKITPEVLRIMNLNSGKLSGGSKKSRRNKRNRWSKKSRISRRSRKH
jgi:hypothetical protein